VATLATTLTGLLIGRSIQGAGAVSAAVTALLADQTRDVVRTKAMALVGISIGLMFAIALVAAPLLTAWIGLSGLFGLTFALTLAGIAPVLWVVPPEPRHHADAPRGHYSEVLRHGDLMRVNLVVCALHTVQMSMWVSVPAMLVQAGLPKAQHWEIYLSAIVLSLIAMGGLFSMERHGRLRAALLLSIGLVLAGQVGFGVLAASGATPSLWALGVTLFVFFCGFNVLEATQPSLASRMSPDNLRGAALGTYNTLQSIGLFLGGAVGGLLVKWGGATGLFTATSLITLAWLPGPGRSSPSRARRGTEETISPRRQSRYAAHLRSGRGCASPIWPGLLCVIAGATFKDTFPWHRSTRSSSSAISGATRKPVPFPAATR